MTQRKALTAVLALLLAVTLTVPPAVSRAAAPLKIRYNGKTVSFTGQQVEVRLDDKPVYMDKTPGLELINAKKEEIYMVSALDVFKKGLGASYKKSGKSITISKNDKTVKMTVGSTAAYVNGVKKTLSYAPLNVTYINAKKTKLLVPARFVAESLGYGYTWTNHSSTSGTIYMTSPYCIYYANKWHVYQSALGRVTYNGKNINVSEMNSVILDGTALVQAKKVFAGSGMNISYGYNKTDKTITMARDGVTLVMKEGSKTAYVNGAKQTMPVAARSIKNSRTKKAFIMVPGQYVANTFGCRYSWDASSKTSVITKGDCSYFDWYVGEDFSLPQESPEPEPLLNEAFAESEASGSEQTEESPEPSAEPEVLPEPSPIPSPDLTPEPESTPEPVPDNYVERVRGSFYKGQDTVTIETFAQADPEITTDDTHVYIKIYHVQPSLEDQKYKVPEVINLKGVRVENEPDGTLITLERKDGAPYSVTQEDTAITITFAARVIKVAVDCGHGSNTPGKRTPPMPFDIDFDGDGIIDVKKGQSIREHTGNTGVGNYLAEELERCGFAVYRSAFGDEDVPLLERQKNIKEAGCDYSVSVHFNAMGNGTTFNSSSGAGVFYHSTYPGDSKELAQTVMKYVLEGTPQRSIGVNGAHSFAMCNTSAMGTRASILVECAFMTNKNEAVNMMANSDYWKETAREIARAFCDYTGMAYAEE